MEALARLMLRLAKAFPFKGRDPMVLKQRSGFTLLEFLVVIIIGVLAAASISLLKSGVLLFVCYTRKTGF